MYNSITPELVADLWERPADESAAIGFHPCDIYPLREGTYRVAPARFIAPAHVVITQAELHGRTVTGTEGSPSLWEALAKDIDEWEPARCQVCGSKSTMPVGWPCEDCSDEVDHPRADTQAVRHEYERPEGYPEQYACGVCGFPMDHPWHNRNVA